MDDILKDLEPKKCFFYFEEISRIPRSSFEEEKIARYVMDFAAARGLEAYEDQAHNVYVSKPASPGYEKRRGVILQAHMDMVCVKDPGVVHDFRNDPIELVIDGDWIRANGTSLGADDGSGVAMMLALLDSDDVPHPPLQCLFTTAEEVGMVGADRLEPERFQGDLLINLDGGPLQRMTTASAGSSVHVYSVDEEREPLSPGGRTALELSLSGLTGGHSGTRAHVGQGNAIKLMAELLAELSGRMDYRLASFTGGMKMNAIPREALAVIAVETGKAEEARNFLGDTARAIAAEYARTDPDMAFSLREVPCPETVLGRDAQRKLVTMADLLRDGTQMFNNEEKTMARVSCNIGILESADGKTRGTCLMRSNSNYEHGAANRRAKRLAALAGVSLEIRAPSFAWEGDGTPLLEKVSALYEAETGNRPERVQTHGGLEIGTIVGKGASAGRTMYGINFGARAENVHTPRERLSISGMAEAYDWLQRILVHLD